MKKQTNLKNRQHGNIEPDNFLFGLLLSDFDNLLLHKYIDYKIMLLNFLQEQRNQNTNQLFIKVLINGINERIADNNRIIKDLDIKIKNERIESGSVSLNIIKKNNLSSVNDKASNLIEELKLFSSTKKKEPEKIYKDLDELFINSKDIGPSYLALSQIKPPLINTSGHFIGKHRGAKGAFVDWIDVLRRKGKLHYISDKFLPDLLMKKFPGLKISDSTFRSQRVTQDHYMMEFSAIIQQKS